MRNNCGKCVQFSKLIITIIDIQQTKRITYCIGKPELKFFLKMASIFGRRQKPSLNKKGPVVGVNQNGSGTTPAGVSENGTNGVNVGADYQTESRHSSTFKPQIPLPSSNSSLPPHDKPDANYSTENKRYTILLGYINILIAYCAF